MRVKVLPARADAPSISAPLSFDAGAVSVSSVCDVTAAIASAKASFLELSSAKKSGMMSRFTIMNEAEL